MGHRQGVYTHGSRCAERLRHAAKGLSDSSVYGKRNGCRGSEASRAHRRATGFPDVFGFLLLVLVADGVISIYLIGVHK